MKKPLLLLLASLFIYSLAAQDLYHNTLLDQLQQDYNLPAGEWLFNNTETANNGDSYNWGSIRSLLNENSMDFQTKYQLTINQQGSNPWSSGWGIKNNISVKEGDRVLMVFYMRSVNGEGKVNFFVEDETTFSKEVILTIPIQEEWRLYMVPFEAGKNYSIGGLATGFHLGHQAQTIELGGYTAINYRQNVFLNDLPNQANNEFYGGWEADAPWRAEAADRIEELRKTDLSIKATDVAGNPINQAAFSVKMLKHDFAFGTAITAQRLAGNNAYNAIYENKLINLDGENHGFNWVVFENDLKWPAWEDHWFVSQPELARAVQWLVDQDIKIRGHNLVWPGNDHLPSDVIANLNDPSYIQNRFNQHIEEVMNYPGIKGNIEEWDVLNEIVFNKTLQNAFAGVNGNTTGREVYQDIFNKAESVDPNIGLWMNEYATITLNNTGGGAYDSLKLYTQELLDSGVKVSGLGFQAHVGGFPNSILDVLNTLDDFYDAFGIPAKITEFDMDPVVSEELAGDYIRDFMTASFSHPSMNGFLLWSFWSGTNYPNSGSNLFRANWSRTPAGDAFVDLVFNEWWSNEDINSGSDGIAEARVFKGLYEISYICDGVLTRDTIEVTEPTSIDITCDNLTTGIEELTAKSLIKVYPNPAQRQLFIENHNAEAATVKLYDWRGVQVLETSMNGAQLVLPLDQAQGYYLLEVQGKKFTHREKILVLDR